MTFRLVSIGFMCIVGMLVSSCKTVTPFLKGYGNEDGELHAISQGMEGFEMDFGAEGLWRFKVPDPGSPIVAITHPELLFHLEQNNYGLSNIFTQVEFDVIKDREHNFAFYNNSPMYNSMVNYLSEQTDRIGRAGDGTHVYGSLDFSKVRLFQKQFLKSRYAKFDLVAVVNRLDKMDFARATDGSFTNCGELRFLYRLAYRIPAGAQGASWRQGRRTTVDTYSRLPFVVNLVFERPANAASYSGCSDVARSWLSPGNMELASYSQWLRDGPLDLASLKLKQVEVNFQAARMPSELKRDMGGHAEYILRIFKIREESGTKRLRPILLENTPDVAKLQANDTLRMELADWIADNVEAIDNGVFVLPEKFLTNQVNSVTTFGLHRKQNLLFSKIFEKKSDPARSRLDSIDMANAKFLKSTASLLTRMDDRTCAGCHQSNSVAGLHTLGVDRQEETHGFNALRLPFSSHFEKELVRRRDYVKRVATGVTPYSFRPLSFQPWDPAGTSPRAKLGERCLTNNDLQSHLKVRQWLCESGLSCIKAVSSAASSSQHGLPIDTGYCMRSQGLVGDVCQKGTMTDHPSDSRQDSFRLQSNQPCREAGCLDPIEGVPLGLCLTSRRNNQPKSDQNGKEFLAYNGGSGFDVCAGNDNWAECISNAGNTTRGLRQQCSETAPCRDDYICQLYLEIQGKKAIAVQDEGKPIGYCVPTYFIFQMRVDGHPITTM
ncbi:MAG: hypothetical protein HRU19_27790 [Pseudobacteriovorax sp.]|nr:hypothetical protein [Pseudobacteriovorax sp.]